MFFKKDIEYFFLIEVAELAFDNLMNQEVYKTIVDICLKEKKQINFSQTFLLEHGAAMLLGTNSLKGDYSLALNAFMFEAYARMKDKIPVSKDFKTEQKEICGMQVEMYTIDNLKTKFE
jgi:hypothetical protein